VAGLLRRDPRIGDWSATTTPSRPGSEPWISELLPDPAGEVAPGAGSGAAQRGDVAGEAHLPPGRARARPQVDDVVGDLDHRDMPKTREDFPDPETR
jgi:hypothetical protein